MYNSGTNHHTTTISFQKSVTTILYYHYILLLYNKTVQKKYKIDDDEYLSTRDRFLPVDVPGDVYERLRQGGRRAGKKSPPTRRRSVSRAKYRTLARRAAPDILAYYLAGLK